VLPHLTGDRCDAFLLIEHQAVAVTTHEFQDQGPDSCFTGSWGELKLHHPLESLLLQADERQLSQPVLNLLRQRAAGAGPFRSWNLHQSGGFGLPAELQPDHSLQRAETQLETVRVRLLGFFESAGKNLTAEVRQHGLEAGEVHHLKRAAGHRCRWSADVGCLPTLQPDCTQAMAPTDRRARLALLTGPSGVGKGTLVARLLERHPQVWLSVSATTRSPRDGEQHGVQYFFHSRPSFDDLVAQGGLLEWAEFAGNCYGTPREPVMQRLDAGTPVLLEIELEGARQVRRSFPEAFQIFLAPPSFEELERRIRGRGTESEESIQKRLDRARAELAAQQEFDAVVVNDDLETALAELERLMNLA